MIVGIGVDVVDMARFEHTITKTPLLVPRLFAPGERTHPPRSLAARFAAKEALIKALGGSGPLHWLDMEVESSESGNPDFILSAALAAHLRAREIDRIHLSMSHDAGIATAFVILER